MTKAQNIEKQNYFLESDLSQFMCVTFAIMVYHIDYYIVTYYIFIC